MPDWNNRILIAGMSGTGKTWAALYIISRYIQLQKRKHIVFISDNSVDYDNKKHHIRIRPGSNGFKLAYYGQREAGLKWNWDKIINKYKRLYIETGNVTIEEMGEMVNDIAKSMWNLGDGLLVIDEAWQYISHSQTPIEVERLSRGGRKKGSDIMIITHRVVDIHPRILNSINLVISFRLTEKNDVERISRYFESDGKINPKVVIPKLKLGEYLIRAVETGEQEKANTFDLFKHRSI